MRVSAKTDYALRALLEMSSRDDGKPVSAEELGRLQGIPHGFRTTFWRDAEHPKGLWRRTTFAARPASSSPSAASPAAGG